LKIRFISDLTEIPILWDRVLPHIVFVNNTGLLTSDHIKAYLENGSYFMWIAEDGDKIVGVLTCYFIEYPLQWCMRIVTLGGENMDSWFEGLPVIEKWAKEYGCTSIELHGRKGWEKFLNKDGYGFENVILRKKL